MVEVTLMKATTLALELPPGIVEGQHSFKQHDVPQGDEERITVHMNQDSWFEAYGERFQFDGVRWFPQITEDHREAKVDLRNDAGELLSVLHLAEHQDLTVARFAGMLERGRIQPAERPER